MADLLQPKEFRVKDQAGTERVYTLSKFPAIQGREIVAKYPLSAMPKLGDYEVNEETMLKLMAFVTVDAGGQPLRLSTRALIDNHVPDWETLARIEIAMMEYNVSFFGNGQGSGFLDAIVKKAQALITSTLMDLSAQSSQKKPRRSTNSEPSTPSKMP